MRIITVKNYKWEILAIVALALLVLPLGNLFAGFATTINQDGTNHWKVFEAIKNGNAQFLYFGQMITGYALVWLEKFTGIDLITSLMIFSYSALVVGGITCMVLVTKVTHSRVAGILSAFVMTFGTGAVMHLFWSGTIFNVVEMIVLFPLALLMLYNLFEEKSLFAFVMFAISVLALVVYHPTFGVQTASSQALTTPAFQSVLGTYNQATNRELVLPFPFVALAFVGITNIAALGISCKFLWEKKLGVNAGIIFWAMLIVASVFGFLAFSGLTAFSSRMAMNFAIVVNLITCLLAGLVIKNREKLSWLVIALLIVGIIPNLVQWVERY